MLGMIEFDGSNGRPCCARRQILGGTFLTLNLGKSACGLLSHHHAARSLVVSCRYVFLSVPTGGESFAREMRRKYGAALILRPSRDQLEQADALVLYAPRPELQQKNKVLCALYPGAAHGGGRMVLTLDEALMANIPPNCAADQLAAALYDLGVLPQEKIKCEITC